ncbi:MAG: 2,3-bisphosphoglycerate-independent phosphoglycerate mutase [Candidatus Margulisiibacteriota bacterium]
MKTTLNPLSRFKGRKGPLLLIIMDGIGLGKPEPDNAVYSAKMPVLNRLMAQPLFTKLKAHGTAVGMPSDEDMGNSEVGHNALGAGRIFAQGASLVKDAIESGSLFKGETWQAAAHQAKANKSVLHFIGLLSDGNVHAHIDHLLAMLSKAAEQGVQTARIHTLLDGRDVAEKSALLYLKTLEDHLAKLNTQFDCDYRVASGGGRMVITMDRYNADWPMVARGWDTHVRGQGRFFASAKEAVETFYQEDPKVIDQYLPPFVVAQNNQPVGRIQDGDAVILFNFRGDRAMELSMAFENEDFHHFDRHGRPKVFFAGMMQYDGDLKLPKHFLVDPPQIERPLSHYFCGTNIASFAISETQKYGHVTYFWNGNLTGYVDETLETYVEIPSDNVPFDQKPDMKAVEITQKVTELLRSGRYHFGRLNFPNGDMVGHSGNLEATIRSCETTDRCVGELINVVNELGGITVVLADHGNADEMATTQNGIRTPKTAHTLNPVPFAIVDSGYANEYALNPDIPTPGLANVAATLCNLLGYQAPDDYEPSLIRFED